MRVHLVALALLLAVPASAGPLLVDTADLRDEVVARRAAFSGTLTARQRRIVRALDEARGHLDASSSTLEGDLRIGREAVGPLEKVYDDPTMEALLDGVGDRAEDLVRGERDVVEAFRLFSHLRFADRWLDAAGRARTHARRFRCLERALGEIREGQDAIPRDDGGGGGGGGDPPAPLSTISMKVDVFNGTPPATWTPDSVSATVTLDGAGNPASFRLLGVVTSAGGPLSSLDLRVDSGFSGTGTYVPAITYDPDGPSTPFNYFTPTPYETPFGWVKFGDMTVTSFDMAERRIKGTFSGNLYSFWRAGATLTEGTFDVRGFVVE